MEILVLPSAEAVGRAVAGVVARLLGEKPDAVLGLPAGSSPRPAYDELARLHREEGLSFARATAFNIDEYVGLPPGHPASLSSFFQGALYRRVDLPPARAHAPDVSAPDLAEACARYEAAIAGAGGFDLVLLGIGGNGHVAFNEPGSPFDSRTRLVTLAPETREASRLAFGGQPVPDRAITIGLGTILSSRACVLLASGAQKADAIARAVEGPETPLLPASALQRHGRVMVIVDEAARRSCRDYDQTISRR